MTVEFTENTNHYETTDLTHAAILMALGFRFMGIGKRNEMMRNKSRHRLVFRIERRDDLESVIASIMNKTVEGNLVEFAHHMAELKRLSHNPPV